MCLDLKDSVDEAGKSWPSRPPTPTEDPAPSTSRPLLPLSAKMGESKKPRPPTPFPHPQAPPSYQGPLSPNPTWTPTPGEFSDLNLLAEVAAEAEAVPTSSVSDGPTELPSAMPPRALVRSPEPLIDLDELLSRGMGQAEYERLVGEDREPNRWYASRLLWRLLMGESDRSPPEDSAAPDPFLPTPPPSPKWE